MPCRMNVNGTWSDGCIHDLSDKGLLVSSANPPAIGTYVDIRRGTLVIIGRVVWTGGRRFGVRTQDAVSIAALLSEPVQTTRPATTDRRGPAREEADRRTVASADRSRQRASAFQFVCLAIIGLGIACCAALYSYQTLAAPFDVVTGVLDAPAD
ncbi:PilZ domain-containing protein [Sphingomonas faeni]|uniref:PilZ domain-containing protein n=1 Tax=Sphingomonas faeni TaxID=185950 RepID=UPI0034A0CD6F